MSGRIYLYPLIIRLWHGCNALLILTLIFTGASLQYSNLEYPLMRFDLAVSIHNVAGILLTLTYIWFIISNIYTKNVVHYYLHIKGLFNRITTQLIYYTWGMFTGKTSPFPITAENKFNPLQRFTYVLAMYVFLPVLILSGWGLLFPGIVIHNIFGLGGIFWADLLHVVMAFLVSAFLIIHVYFCTIGATFYINFKSMIDGWHVSK
ncbi:MAG: cytochrome b/b6 domain-containing protein [Bacteroidales bacterium]|nr:cytochrome b/b6 domain-containing protein [Bacteroidales bacterium]